MVLSGKQAQGEQVSRWSPQRASLRSSLCSSVPSSYAPSACSATDSCPAIMEVNAWCCTLSAKCLMLGAVRAALSVCLGLMVVLGGNGLESWNAQKGEFLRLSYCIHLQYSFLSPQFPLLLILWANSWRTGVTAHWQPGYLWGHLYLRRSRIFITVQFYPFCGIFAA